MKKIFLTVLLVLVNSDGFSFENKQLNVLYEQLQQYSEEKTRSRSKVATVVYLVGADNACQHGLIEDAIAAANLTGDAHTYEIRVANNKSYTENLLINRVNLSLKGGYSNCSDANNDILSNSNTTLNASGMALPAIIFRNLTTTKHYNNIYNFEVTGGTNNGSNRSGGVNVRDDFIKVNIENSLIISNVGTKGGGLFVEGSSSAVYIKDTLLLLNDANNGGGLYCDAADVYLYGGSGISANNATGNFAEGSGGGAYLTNGCNFNVFSGTTGGLFDFRGIAGNTANRDGGGIYADGGTQVILMGYLFIGEFGNNEMPVNITGNTANNSTTTRFGGGIYAEGVGTNISAYATIINNNQTLTGTTSSAGAVYLFQADFSIGKLDLTCWNQQKCNQIIGNKASSYDAGIVAFTGSTVSIKNTWISGHSSGDNVFLFGQFINAVIEGNVFTGNGGPSIDGNKSLLSFYGDSSNLSIAYNTFVNNEINNSLFRIFNTPTLFVHGNIIKENNNVDILQVASGGSDNTQFNCLVVHEDQSFSGSSIFVADPEFVDEVNEDFHIKAISPAIDLCGDIPYTSTTKDLDDEDRAWDELLVDNLDGIKDAGVDEYNPNTGVIFVNSFE